MLGDRLKDLQRKSATDTALARSLGFSALSLVAVNDSRGFWERQGFRVVERPELAAKLASYEAAAVLMEKAL